MLNDISSDHFSIVLSLGMADLQINNLEAFPVNWQDFRHVVEGTKIPSADDVTSSIETFGDSFYNMFKQDLKQRQIHSLWLIPSGYLGTSRIWKERETV